jgi:O-methyltransferase
VLAKILGPMRALGRHLGLDHARTSGTFQWRPVEEDEDEETVRFVRPYTMTSRERICALCSAVRYIARAGIEGAMVECGVWRGGSMMAAALALLDAADTDRDLYLFDTFEGMSPPTAKDVSVDGKAASALLRRPRTTAPDSPWCYAGLDDVRTAMAGTRYPSERIHFIPGRVEDTLPHEMPSPIAVLRLDTDWYESTRHELEHLYPLLSPGGVLIVDDYGHWAGCRKAVDEYLTRHNISILLHRVDYTGRVALKPR